MSDIIQLLPDSVANQIAAGEVIQRPASVIKELVENAVDAGAKTINVLVVDAGRTMIQVIDDGKGMSDTDARLAFERHATSKIRQAADLFDLHTMGFRGEALASIAAVAQVELRTRMADREIGTLLTLEGTRVTGQEPVACPVGSNFKIENLFYNVPARRKFLKSNSTELNNIMTAFERIALVYPEISFTMHSNGLEVMNLHAGTLRQRIVDVFGKRLNHDLLPIDVETSLCSITGFVGKPESAKKKGVQQYFFVNGRYMKHPYFHKSVMNTYERMIPVGMQVPYFIYFTVPAGDIDVNIHPTKTEIKFENEQAIWQILTAAVNDSIGKFCEIPSIDFDTEGQPEIPLFDPSYNIVPPKPQYNPTYNPFETTSTVEHKDKVIDQWEELYKGLHTEETFPQVVQSKIGNPIEDRSPSHYQYKGKYIMTAVKSGLMIIDQNRADIRIRYERFMNQMEQEVSRTQKVLFPEVVQFAPSAKVMVVKLLPYLQKVGFDLTDLGGNSFSVNGVPAGLEDINSVSLLQEIVADATEKGCASATDIHSTLALGMARRSAVTYGEVLGNEEMETLVNDLFASSNVNYTPDGKAILSILPQRDIEQLLN
ncbi:MAG: DNA mismatch repair endonuclease MutL [Prevotellaceae bacterium]|nr:DNA mismatch repair endonuclease MutL [Prevotellaceae bacterium]MDY5209336.1 DNA mismatch repair endonuclease MutL [Prevotella sp.]